MKTVGGWIRKALTNAAWCDCSFPPSDAAWADISGSVEERKQHLEESNKNLDIFKTTELQLGQWLSEKELMMSVLGPLSIDPNMLKMQKQQVQVRRDVTRWEPPTDWSFFQIFQIFISILFSISRSSRTNSRTVKASMNNSRTPPPPSSAQATKTPRVGSW